MNQTLTAMEETAGDLMVRARMALAPLLRADVPGPHLAGRPFEYVGRGDPLADDADLATGHREGVLFRSLTRTQVAAGLARVTPEWIAAQVEGAIVQSAPERALAEGGADAAGGQIHRPARPAAILNVPALALGPLIDAVDADACRLAKDPEQEFFRARALPAVDGGGRISDRELARTLAMELAELNVLSRAGTLDERAARRRDALGRAAQRRARYARAFALAARQLATRHGRVDARQLFHAFNAVAGLDKAPFRHGPSEHLTSALLAELATQFYELLRDPDHTVSLLLLTFPIKNSSGLRTNVPTEAADFGEVLMLAQFRRMLEFLRTLGFERVRIICLTDGIVYSRYLGPYDRAQAVLYRENVRRFRDALGLAGSVLIVDAEHLLHGVPGFDEALARMHVALEAAERCDARVQRKLLSLTRSFLFHLHARDEDLDLLVKVVNACLRDERLSTPGERAEQDRLWTKAATDARWYAAHLLLMSALDAVRQVVATPYVRATVHPKPGQFAPAPVNVRDFTDLPYHRKPLLRAGANPMNLDTYLGVNLWSDPSLRFVDVCVGSNRAPFLGVRV